MTLFGPCDGTVAGEVITLAPERPASTDTPVDPAKADIDCWDAAVDYVGLDPSKDALALSTEPTADQREPGLIRWRREVEMRAQVVHSDPASNRIGRGWVACTLTPRSGAMYTGLIRDAFGDGQLPATFATCQNSSETTGGRVACSTPHNAELLALGLEIDASGTSDADLAGSCQHLAARLMRHDDPTVNGQLVIVAYRQSLMYNDIVRGVLFSCLVTGAGERMLDRSVIGLGSSPVPFAR